MSLDPSVPIDSTPGADVGYITQTARQGSTGGWVEEHMFTGSPRLAFKLENVAYLTGRFPIVRHSGTFVVAFANTTWRLENVRFDTPAPDRQPQYSVVGRARTPAEQQECVG